jgi:hypothetical protein
MGYRTSRTVALVPLLPVGERGGTLPRTVAVGSQEYRIRATGACLCDGRRDGVAVDAPSVTQNVRAEAEAVAVAVKVAARYRVLAADKQTWCDVDVEKVAVRVCRRDACDDQSVRLHGFAECRAFPVQKRVAEEVGEVAEAVVVVAEVAAVADASDGW